MNSLCNERDERTKIERTKRSRKNYIETRRGRTPKPTQTQTEKKPNERIGPDASERASFAAVSRGDLCPHDEFNDVRVTSIDRPTRLIDKVSESLTQSSAIGEPTVETTRQQRLCERLEIALRDNICENQIAVANGFRRCQIEIRQRGLV